MAKKLQITKDAMDKLHKGEEVSIDGVTLTFPVNEEKIEIGLDRIGQYLKSR